MSKLSDNWQTPQALFDALNNGGEYMGMEFDGFHFDIDLCATKENSKCVDFCDDYLNNSVHISMFDDSGSWPLDLNCIKNAAFMNPPYSNPKPFIEKAWEDARFCRIVALVKCDPSTQWWATFWNYADIEAEDGWWDRRGPKPGCQVLFFPKRIQFDPPQELIDVWKVKNKWVRECELINVEYHNNEKYMCGQCKGKGYKPLAGPTFPCALLIFDRRGL